MGKDPGERITVQARTTARIREMLEAAAMRSGRSMSQEMEMRLEQSFIKDDIVSQVTEQIEAKNRDNLIDIFGGAETYSLLSDLNIVISAVETDMGGPWHGSPETKAKLYKVLEIILPSLMRADRSGAAIKDSMSRFMEIQQFIPHTPRVYSKPVPPQGLRFMTEEERQQFFYLNDDNADPPGSKAAKRRERSVVVPLDKD